MSAPSEQHEMTGAPLVVTSSSANMFLPGLKKFSLESGWGSWGWSSAAGSEYPRDVAGLVLGERELLEQDNDGAEGERRSSEGGRTKRLALGQQRSPKGRGVTYRLSERR